MLNKRKKASKTDANAQLCLQPLCYYVSCNFDHISKRIWLAGVEDENFFFYKKSTYHRYSVGSLKVWKLPAVSILFILNPSFQVTSNYLCNCDFLDYFSIMCSLLTWFHQLFSRNLRNFKQLECCQLHSQYKRINFKKCGKNCRFRTRETIWWAGQKLHAQVYRMVSI